MKYIKQKHQLGCAVACLAMLTDVSYEGALNYIYPDRKPYSKIAVNQKKMFDILKELNFKPEVCIKDINTLKSKALLIIDGPVGYTHAVVWDPKSKMVLDPQAEYLNKPKNVKKHNEFYQKNLRYLLKLKS